ncbi:MAG: putative toxin-antitoxin system toxin component, PIN family [Mariprofundaceae bacterium]
MRVVFDSNVLLSALLFKGGSLCWLRDAWKKEAMSVLISNNSAAELIRVLAYPKFKLSHNDIDLLLADYLPYTTTIVVDESIISPTCRDKHDQMFINLAICGEADALVTGDKDLLMMRSECDFHIESPADFRERIKQN